MCVLAGNYFVSGVCAAACLGLCGCVCVSAWAPRAAQLAASVNAAKLLSCANPPPAVWHTEAPMCCTAAMRWLCD
jgi:hypothetical protein